ncbi:flagellar hook-associated protein FlgK [Sporomusa acidovorans]|uniref:Flagellar hook-associated protein 1 n=1 Tax=Sporomusa acidovorans (strain ATCC 49682 / DSM 3132 / Mol) TaxID=1123286 RepID=A0ABZ3IXL1_SPOA4|nr:flagellar hook-associated protein FlgK [Sporomusa acidovorans]OZC22411.1 flagellar hook-associated protein 1 [Sporomusa acidovorans DSM 3132]SDE48490.1 flagellar hook-associated protein 1 FlgK [Sporomusa acidovorans]
MASTFAGLSIANRGLTAAQVGLTVTTNNMSNIDTDGYSRQVVSQTSIGPAAVYSSSLVGNGVEVTSVDRVNSFRLNQKYWQENSSASELEVTSNYMEKIEDVFGTTDSSDISEALDTFEAELETLADDPTNESIRKIVLSYAKSFCDTLNTAAEDLESIRDQLNTEVNTAVEEINSYASQIAELNRQISTASASGASTNELEDQRDVIVDKLSGLVGISVTEADDSTYTITVDGVTLVKGDEANELECYTVTDSDSDSYGMYGIRWAESGKDFDSGDSGSLTGYLQMRDGSTADSKGVVYYMNQLDKFAQTFAQAFNEGVTVTSDSGTETTYSGHVDGVGIDDDETTGIRFFTYDDVSSADFVDSGSDLEEAYSNITAANISVSKDIQDDTTKIAASSTAGEESNTDVLDDLIDICSDVNISGNSTATEMYNLIVATVAGDSASAETAYSSKSATATYINTSRTSVSGVSSDEETVNLTTYQSAYAASASMVSAWSEIYDTTISMVDD